MIKKYLKRTMEGVEYVGKAIVEEPGAAVGGFLVGVLVGGPVGGIAGMGTLAAAAKASTDDLRGLMGNKEKDDGRDV